MIQIIHMRFLTKAKRFLFVIFTLLRQDFDRLVVNVTAPNNYRSSSWPQSRKGFGLSSLINAIVKAKRAHHLSSPYPIVELVSLQSISLESSMFYYWARTILTNSS